MTDSSKSTLERIAQRIPTPDEAFDSILLRRQRRNRNQRIAAGVVGMTIFVASVWIVRDVALRDTTPTPGGGGIEEPRRTAVGPVPDTDYLVDLDSGTMTPLPPSIDGAGQNEYAASPDGSTLAYVSKGDNGKTQVFVANIDGTAIQQVTHGLEAASSPVWSPDGSKIAYTGYHDGDLRDLFVVDLATGTSTQLSSSTKEPDPSEPDLSPWRSTPAGFTSDGASVVYFAERDDTLDKSEGEIRSVPVTGGESVRLGRASIGAVLSPDGSRLVYGCGDRLGSICVANPDGSDERDAGPFLGDVIDGGAWSPDGSRVAYFRFPTIDVMVADIATGEVTHVGEGLLPSWLDDHTLIIEMNGCYDHVTGHWRIGECGA